MVSDVAGPSSSSYFAFFSTQKDAAFAAQTRIHPEDSHSFRVMEAPGPEEACLCLADQKMQIFTHKYALSKEVSASNAPLALSEHAVLQLNLAGLTRRVRESLQGHMAAFLCRCSHEGLTGGVGGFR